MVPHHPLDGAHLSDRPPGDDRYTGRGSCPRLLLQMTVRINGVMIGTQSITCHGKIVVQSQGGHERRVCIKFLEPSLLTSKVKRGQVSLCLNIKKVFCALFVWRTTTV